MKPMPFNGAGETPPFADADDINSIPHLENLDRYLLALLQIAKVANSELTQMS